MNDGLLTVPQALERLLEGIHALDAETVPLEDALGRTLAEDVEATTDLPPFEHSSMDGYAVRAADVASASQATPVELQVSGDIAAGAGTLPRISSGQAIRIMTGGPIPDGADCVVPVEVTSDHGPMAGRSLPEQIEVYAASQAGQYVRAAGMDVRKGRNVLEAGHRLRPQDLALLGALGVANPQVIRKPRVAVLSTGDELVPVHQALEAGKIRDSNGVMIRTFLTQVGAQTVRLEIAHDTRESVLERLNEAVAQEADLILSTAGVSMGAYDFVRSVLQTHGKLEFWKVNIRPGKPLAFGSFKDVPFIGLPGNPVSAFVTFVLFVWPVIERLSGSQGPERWPIEAVLGEDVQSDGRESYLRAEVTSVDGRYRARLTGSQDSGVMTSLVSANALVIVPAGVTHLAAGTTVNAWMLGGPH